MPQDNENTATRAVIRAFRDHLEDKIPEIKEFYMDFPESNARLKFPAISIVQGPLRFTPQCAYEWTKTDPSASHTSEVLWVVGLYDWDTLQVDIWSKDKEQRHFLLDRFFRAMHTQLPVSGVSLQLADYHDLYCHYDMTGHRFEDSEIGSQRKEWRVTVDVLASAKAIMDSTEYAMEDFDVDEQYINTDTSIEGD